MTVDASKVQDFRAKINSMSKRQVQLLTCSLVLDVLMEIGHIHGRIDSFEAKLNKLLEEKK